MSSKAKGIKVEVEKGHSDLESTTYKITVSVPTKEAIVMEWLASQNAIESINSYISKTITNYFHQSSSQVKKALMTSAKEQKLAQKKSTNKPPKTKNDKQPS
jgi:hypothetical protein